MVYAHKRKPNPMATREAQRVQRLTILDPALHHHDQLRADLTRFTSRTPTLLRQWVGPVLRALQLQRQELDRIADQRQALQCQFAELGSQRPQAAVI